MTKPTEQEIEHVARAMCANDGFQEDELERRWKNYTGPASQFLAGWHAMKEWN